MEETLQLVSVCVITYNSVNTVLETLDSVYAQTYPKLELIISDDCSSDETVNVCQKWVDKHKERFENTKLLVRGENGGVAKNLNTAIMVAGGDWVKTIAGDDLLMPGCIQDNMDYVRCHDSQEVFFSKIRYFREEGGRRVVTDYVKPDHVTLGFFSLTAEQQYNLLMSSSHYIPGPSFFQKRSFAQENPFPELYPFCEDWPHWLHLAERGVPLRLLDRETVLYRQNGSLSHSRSKEFINVHFHYSMMAFFYAERYPVLCIRDNNEARRQRKMFLLGEIAIVVFRNQKNLFSRSVLFVLRKVLGVNQIL